MVLIAGLTIAVGVGAARSARARQERLHVRALAADSILASGGVRHGAVVRKPLPSGTRQRMSPTDLRARVSNLSPGTYIGDILMEQDSTLYQWPERFANAVRVHIAPGDDVAGWDAASPAMARAVFDEWSIAGFPLRFVFIYDPASADIIIQWVDRFAAEEGQRIGLTERTHTSEYAIASARIDIATHDSTGRRLSAGTVAGIVRHEVGHALGLNHASDPTSVMFRESATSTISASDRATLRLLYLVPPGSLKE